VRETGRVPHRRRKLKRKMIAVFIRGGSGDVMVRRDQGRCAGQHAQCAFVVGFMRLVGFGVRVRRGVMRAQQCFMAFGGGEKRHRSPCHGAQHPPLEKQRKPMWGISRHGISLWRTGTRTRNKNTLAGVIRQ